jgi:hypothetical protein
VVIVSISPNASATQATDGADTVDREEQLRWICRDAAWLLRCLNQSDADGITDHFVDGVIAALRADPRMPRRSVHEWWLFFGDLRRKLSDDLANIIDNHVDRDDAVDTIVRELESEEA